METIQKHYNKTTKHDKINSGEGAVDKSNIDITSKCDRQIESALRLARY